MYTTFRHFIHFVYKFKRVIAAKFCIQTVRRFVEMWDTFCIQTICMQLVYINSDLQKVYIIKIMFIYSLSTKFIQNVYTNNSM